MKIIKKLKKFKKEQNEDSCINLKYEEVIHILKKIKKSSNNVKNSSIQNNQNFHDIDIVSNTAEKCDLFC